MQSILTETWLGQVSPTALQYLNIATVYFTFLPIKTKTNVNDQHRKYNINLHQISHVQEVLTINYAGHNGILVSIAAMNHLWWQLPQRRRTMSGILITILHSDHSPCLQAQFVTRMGRNDGPFPNYRRCLWPRGYFWKSTLSLPRVHSIMESAYRPRRIYLPFQNSSSPFQIAYLEYAQWSRELAAPKITTGLRYGSFGILMCQCR